MHTRSRFLVLLGESGGGCGVLDALRACSRPAWLIVDLPQALQKVKEAWAGSPPSFISDNPWPEQQMCPLACRRKCSS